MKINLKNTSQIEKALAKENGKCTTFCTTTANDLRLAVVGATETLLGKGLKKTSLVGTELTYRPAGPHSGYGYDYWTNEVTLILGRRDQWFLTHIIKFKMPPSAKGSRSEIHFYLDVTKIKQIYDHTFYNISISPARQDFVLTPPGIVKPGVSK